MYTTTSTKFDLEQAILNCWSITEDIRTVSEKLSDNFGLSDELDKYQTIKVLNGIAALYELKFSKCFDLFEKMLQEQYKK